MNAILVDSDILIEVSRGRDRGILEHWDRLGAEEASLAVSPVSVAELWHGARNSEEPALRNLFSNLICLPADAEIGSQAGGFLRRFHKSHGLELGDALIGAAAVVHGIPLWTRNRRHYPMKDLKFYL